MIADKEDFTNKFGFIAINALLYDVLLEMLNLSGNVGCIVHIYGSLVGIFIYYEQKNGHLDWLLDKGTINNATSSEIFRSDEITSGYGNHAESEIEYQYPAEMQVEGSNDNIEMDDLYKRTEFAAAA